MKRRKKRSWLLNFLLMVTLVASFLAFTAHYKNWTRTESDHFKVLSGIYYEKVDYAEIQSIQMVPKLPPMERISGFSVKRWEKGVFKDSVSQHISRVYVDDLRKQKIQVAYRDSLKLFLNFTDSLKTDTMYQFLKRKKDSLQKLL